MEKGYIAHFARAYKGKDQCNWTGLVLEGDMNSVFRPSRIYKRLLNKAFKDKADAVNAAEKFMKRNHLKVWVGRKSNEA